MFELIKNAEAGIAVGSIDVEPCTLHIDTNLIRLYHKELEIEFELDSNKFKNIDKIIINGYKYVKPKEQNLQALILYNQTLVRSDNSLIFLITASDSASLSVR